METHTGKLRWVDCSRDGWETRILQQEWYNGKDYFWRDVPVEREESSLSMLMKAHEATQAANMKPFLEAAAKTMQTLQNQFVAWSKELDKEKPEEEYKSSMLDWPKQKSCP